MNPLFEMPELLMLSGEQFVNSDVLGTSQGGGCSPGCTNGCCGGCDQGSGSGNKATVAISQPIDPIAT